MAGCLITEISGDLFSAVDSFSMAHCVAADLKMGKGIAIKFREKFGQITKLKQQQVCPGGVAVLQDGERFIYYLITKQSSWSKPTYQSMHNSLSAMRDHMIKHAISKLAIPRIGCGLDGLVWSKVREQLQEIFNGDSIQIMVYNYSPNKG